MFHYIYRPVKEMYTLRCQFFDQDIDREILSNEGSSAIENSKTQAFCGLWVVHYSCPRDSIVMGSTIDYWVDVFATITVHFRCAR